MAIYLLLFDQPPQDEYAYKTSPSGNSYVGLPNLLPPAGAIYPQSDYIVGTIFTTPSPITPAIIPGYCIPAYKFWYYNEIKVIPPLVNIGRVLSDYNPSIEVWNAYIEEAKTLVSIAGPTEEEVGITLTPVDGDPPTLYNPLQSRYFNLYIDFEGPPSANATYTFNFTNELPTLNVVGYRLIMFPYVPQEGYIERFRWLTDVMQSFDGSEQFVKVRPTPRRELSYTYQGSNTIDRGKFFNILASSIGYEVGVPIWQQGNNLTQNAGINDTRIYVDTTNAEFEEGKPAFLFQDEDVKESCEVSSVQPTYVDVINPIENAYDTSALLLPVLICDMPKQVNSTLNARNGTRVEILFKGKESTNLGTQDLPDQYKSYDVLHDCPEIAGGSITWTHNGNWEEIDFMTGLSKHDYAVQYAKTTRAFRKTFQQNRDGVWDFKQWFYKISGRQGKFWVPSYTGKIQVVGTVPSSSVDIDIVNTQLATVQLNTPFVTDIEFEFLDGTIVRRDVITVVRKSSAEETITVNATIDRDFTQDDIKQISLLHLVRLDSDTIDFQWEDNGTCSVAFNTREVIN